MQIPGIPGGIFRFQVDSRFSRSPDYHVNMVKATRVWNECFEPLYPKLLSNILLEAILQQHECDLMYSENVFLRNSTLAKSQIARLQTNGNSTSISTLNSTVTEEVNKVPSQATSVDDKLINPLCSK